MPFPDKTHYLVADRKLSLQILTQNNIKALSDKQQFWDIYNKLKDCYGEDRVENSGIISLCECTAIVPFYENNKIVYMQGLNSAFKRLLKGIDKKDLYFPKDFPTYDSKITTIYVVEGAIDVLTSLTLGYKSVGIIDAGIKQYNEFDKLKDFPIVLIGDFDKAGLKAKIRIYKYLEEGNFKIFSSSIIKLANNLVKKKQLKEEDIKKIKDLNDILRLLKKDISNE